MGFKSPVIPYGISGLAIPGFRTPLPFFSGGGSIVVPTGDCIPWIGSGWTQDCVDQLYTNSWVCCVVTPEFIPRPERTQDFEANQRLLQSEEVNRDLTTEGKSGKLLFNEQTRTTEKTATNRKLSTGSKGKSSTFSSKNRILH